MTHIDFIFLTIKKENLRVAVGNKKGYKPIVFTYNYEQSPEYDNYYSYCAYLDTMTEAEGLEMQDLVENKRTRKAHGLILKKIDTANCMGPCGPIQLSDLIPDEWFDGCKWVMDMLFYPKHTGVYGYDYDESYDCM